MQRSHTQTPTVLQIRTHREVSVLKFELFLPHACHQSRFETSERVGLVVAVLAARTNNRDYFMFLCPVVHSSVGGRVYSHVFILLWTATSSKCTFEFFQQNNDRVPKERGYVVGRGVQRSWNWSLGYQWAARHQGTLTLLGKTTMCGSQ